MLPGWLDGRPAKEFGLRIAKEIQQALPVQSGAKTKKDAGKRVQKLARIVEKTSRESKEHRFNFYQKAKFANALRWSLKDSGYAPDFIEEVLGLILARM